MALGAQFWELSLELRRFSIQGGVLKVIIIFCCLLINQTTTWLVTKAVLAQLNDLLSILVIPPDDSRRLKSLRLSNVQLFSEITVECNFNGTHQEHEDCKGDEVLVLYSLA